MGTLLFEYKNVSASERLEAFTAKKLQKVFNRYEFVIRADVFFKTENTSDKDSGKICGIRLSAPGPRLFSESSKASFEEAIDVTVDELLRQLNRRKDKMKSY